MLLRSHVRALACALLAFCAAPAATQQTYAQPPSDAGQGAPQVLPALVNELARRGYREQDLEKILGGNVLSVMRQVEQVGREMQAAR